MRGVDRHSGEPIVKLDLKDRKILFELDFNARIPYSRLAKRVGLSKQGVEYRVKNLMKKGVIKGFYPVINVPKLGYIYCRLLLTLQNITKEKRDEIIEYLKGHRKVFWLFSMQGMFDLLIVIWAKSITEFKEFVEEIETKFGKNIKRKVETITTDVIHYQHRYLLGKKETKEIHIKETNERVEVDDLDMKILDLLCADARIPLVKISERVNESAKVVAYRIKKLEKVGIIEGYRPIIDHNKLGFTYYKVLIDLYNISKETLARIKLHVKNNPAVIYIVEGIGLPADLEIEMMVESNKELFDFINDLRFRFPKIVGEYNTVIFMDTLKVKYLPS